MAKGSPFYKRCFSLEVSSWEEKLKITSSESWEEVAIISQLKLGIRVFSFGRCLILIRSNSFSLSMSDMFKTWWKSIMFKADFTFYREVLNLYQANKTHFISSCNNFFWHRLYVQEVCKIALVTLKHKNLEMTLWSSQMTA